MRFLTHKDDFISFLSTRLQLSFSSSLDRVWEEMYTDEFFQGKGDSLCM